METQTPYTKLDNEEIDNLSGNEIETSLKRRSSKVKLCIFAMCLLITIAIIAIVILYSTNNNIENELLDLKWNDEITSDIFESYSDSHKKQIFVKWKQDNNRSYDTMDEHNKRYQIWHNKWKEIADINSRNLSYKVCMNKFGDLQNEEFTMWLGYKPKRKRQLIDTDTDYYVDTDYYYIDTDTDYYTDTDTNSNNDIPSGVDWTALGFVTPVKSQGQCGSCWSFATTGSIECVVAKNGGELISLSEQELVDCSSSNSGCDGGEPYLAMEYVSDNNGLCTESSYPYIDGNYVSNEQCLESSKDCQRFGDISGFTKISVNDEATLEQYIYNSGCVAVAINADSTSFNSYSSGILQSDDCIAAPLNHAVLIVGYGISNGVEYWKVKNSWNTDWGDNGYIRICKNCGKNGVQGECGINGDPVIAKL